MSDKVIVFEDDEEDKKCLSSSAHHGSWEEYAVSWDEDRSDEDATEAVEEHCDNPRPIRRRMNKFRRFFEPFFDMTPIEVMILLLIFGWLASVGILEYYQAKENALRDSIERKITPLADTNKDSFVTAEELKAIYSEIFTELEIVQDHKGNYFQYGNKVSSKEVLTLLDIHVTSIP